MSKKKKKAKAPSESSVLKGQISALQDKLTGETQTPTADETNFQNQLNTLQTSAAMGVSDAEDPRKNPVSLGFQTGQAKSITDRATNMSTPLTSQLAQLQARRQSAISADQNALANMTSQYQFGENLSLQKKSLKASIKAAKVKATSKKKGLTTKVAPKAKKIKIPKVKKTKIRSI